MANTINCPVCGKLTDSRLDSCPHCGAYLKSRRQKQAGAGGAKSRKACPRCGSGVAEGDIICVSCGTNLLTGQRIVDEKASQRRRQSIPTGWLVGVGAAAVIAVIIGGLWIYAVSRDPLSQARRLAEQGRDLEALTILEQYVGNAPTDGTMVLELARLQWRVKQYDKAAQNFAKAASLDPKNAEAAVYAARAAAASSTVSPAQLANLLEKAVALEPDDSGLWYTLALARGTSGNVNGSIEALDRVVSLRATDDSAHLSLGIAHAIEKNHDQASTEFMTVGDGPRKAEALAGLGFASLLNGDTNEASRRLAEAVKSGELPSAAYAHLALGQMQLVNGQFTDAQAELEKAIAAQPDNREARFFLALCLRAQGRAQESLTEFENVANTVGPFAAEAALQAAEVQLGLNAPDRARRSLESSARSGGKTAAYFTVQGRVSLATGDEESAMQSFESAVRADASYAAAYLERGLLNIRREALGPGLADLDRYLKLVGDRGQGTRIEEVRALADQLRQAAQGSKGAPASTARGKTGAPRATEGEA